MILIPKRFQQFKHAHRLGRIEMGGLDVDKAGMAIFAPMVGFVDGVTPPLDAPCSVNDGEASAVTGFSNGLYLGPGHDSVSCAG